MVRTSKGPAEKSKPAHAPDKPTAEDKKMERSLDVDDATWDRIAAMATSQSIEPAEVVRRAITQVYGSEQPTGAYHSGMGTDPSLG